MNDQDSVNFAVFFISTGRCATQFFDAKISEHFEDRTVVTHEPFHVEYKPVFNFACYHQNESVELLPAVEQHLTFIEEVLAQSHYIETGWPVYGLIPHMISRFKDRIKIVHLYRHPLKVAASLTTHNVYSRGEWSDVMSISPATDGVAQSHLAGEMWRRMSEFEKSLFWWTEINYFALELRKSYPSIPWLSLRFEDVFSANGPSELTRLARFLDLPERAGFAHSNYEKTDRFSRKTDKRIDVGALVKSQMARSVMESLGYDINDSIIHEMKSRYEMTWRDKACKLYRRCHDKVNGLRKRFA